jgi:vacuolar protein sorting-associated protein 13A/C
MAIGTISGAPLMLNQLKVENARMSQNQLMARLIQHYQNEGLSQLYRVLASADFLGNPAGLFSNVSSGVQDLFYEPFNGVVLHGGSELGVGIARVSHYPLRVSYTFFLASVTDTIPFTPFEIGSDESCEEKYFWSYRQCIQDHRVCQ